MPPRLQGRQPAVSTAHELRTPLNGVIAANRPGSATVSRTISAGGGHEPEDDQTLLSAGID